MTIAAKFSNSDVCRGPSHLLHFILSFNLSVIRQKGESQNGGNKKKKYAKFSENRSFLTAWYAHVCFLPPDITYQGLRNFRFSRNSACFAFLLPPFWDSLFYLITDEFADCYTVWKVSKQGPQKTPHFDTCRLVLINS